VRETARCGNVRPLEMLGTVFTSALAAARRALTNALAAVAHEGRTRRSPWVLVLGLVGIFFWQRGLANSPRHYDDTYRVSASAGMHAESRFYYFLRHLGVYPLATIETQRADTRAEAERILREKPRSLYLDFGVTFRSGDRGRVYLYWADTLLNRRESDARKPSIRTANAAGFVLGLWGVFAALWWLRRPTLAVILVAILGSNPFQLYATYFQQNVFAWPINAMLLALAVNLPLFDGAARRSKLPWAIALTTGLLLATLRTVRSEPAALVGSAVMVYALMQGAPWWKRAGMIVVLLASFGLATRAYGRHFVRQTERVNAMVAARGGVPYYGPVEPYHEFWHPVWCGLGDFDGTHGYKWDDLEAYKYAFPLMRQRADVQRGLNRFAWAQPVFFDSDARYPMFFSEAPGYHEIIRDKVLKDIRENPRWYREILRNRVDRVLTTTTPVSVSAGDRAWRLDSEKWGLFWIGCALYFLARRDGFALKLLLFSAPLSATALLIYSGGGLTMYSCAHLFAAALFVYELARRAAQTAVSG
jgi:hypothetical protein